MRIFCAVLTIVAAAILGLGAASVRAEPIILVDGNSIAGFDPTALFVQYSWEVDQKNYLFWQGFLYRFDGTGGGELLLPSLGPATVVTADTNGDLQDDFMRLTYTGNTLNVEIILGLSGGSWGSGRSGIGETIRITNTGTAPTGLHFFQYADFDLSSPPNDTVKIENRNTARQAVGGSVLSETVDTPMPSHFDAGYYGDILGALLDGAPTTLGDSPGPYTGDAAWAFQWDVTIDPGETFLISKTKGLVVPEPATLCLMGFGVAGLLARRRSK